MMEAVEYSPDERYARYPEELGQGAYKTVYKAFDTNDALEVAWNKLHVDRLPAAEVAKVETEVALLRAVSHRNIINLYAFWREPRPDGRPASMDFITELMSSGTLKQYLKRSKSIKLRVIRRWCANLLDAIAYLHARSPPIMHRDLKCDNIFINGHLGEVKLGDLGLSRVKSRTSASSCIGTPEFMAPELYDEKYTELVDVYSFGMCLLEMITREYPYSECSNAAQIYRKVTTGEPPRALTTMIDCDVKSVILSCLKREAHRPSAAELLEHPLFRCWSSDDGTLSNLALIRGTPECTAAVAAAPPNAFLPDGKIAACVIATATPPPPPPMALLSVDLADTMPGTWPSGPPTVEPSGSPRAAPGGSTQEAPGGTPPSGPGESPRAATCGSPEAALSEPPPAAPGASTLVTPGRSPLAASGGSAMSSPDRSPSAVPYASPAAVPAGTTPALAVAPVQVVPPLPLVVVPVPRGVSESDTPAAPQAPSPSVPTVVVPAPIASPDADAGLVSLTDLMDEMRVTLTDGPLGTPAAANAAGGKGTQKLQMGLQMPVRGEMKQIAFVFDPAEDQPLQVASEMVAEFHLDPSQTEALAVDISRQVEAARVMGSSSTGPLHAGVPSLTGPPTQDVSDMVRGTTNSRDSVRSEVASALTAPLEGSHAPQPVQQPTLVRETSERRRNGPLAAPKALRVGESKLRTSGSSASSHRAASNSPSPGGHRSTVPTLGIPGASPLAHGVAVHRLLSSDAGVARTVEKENSSLPAPVSARPERLTPVVIESKPAAPRPTNATVTTPKANGLASILGHGSGSSRSTANGAVTLTAPASLALPTSITDAGAAAAAARPGGLPVQGSIDGRDRNKPAPSDSHKARTLGRRASPSAETPIPVVMISPSDADVQRSTSRKVVPSKSAPKLKEPKESKSKPVSRGKSSASVKAPGRPRPSAGPESGGRVTMEGKRPSSKSTGSSKPRSKTFTVSAPNRARGSNTSASAHPPGLPHSVSGTLAPPDADDEDEFDGAHYALCMQLMNASAGGSRDLVLNKLEKGASADFADYDRRTALHIATSNGHCAVAQLLIEYGADVNARDRWGSTPLADAIKNKHAELVALLEQHGGLDENGESPSMRVESQSIQLMAMCARGSLARAANHLALGALPNHADYDGRRPLHIACSEGHHEVVDMLLTAGASWDVTDRFGNSPAVDALNNEHYDCLRVLRQHGAPVPPFPDEEDEADMTSDSGHDSEYDDSQVAVSDADDTGSGQSEENVGVVVTRAAQFVQDAADGNTAAVEAYIAAMSSRDGAAAGGVNFADYEGNTALHQACAKGHVAVVGALLSAGADVSVRDRWGLTPADQARASALPVTGAILSLLSEAATWKQQRPAPEQPAHFSVGEERGRLTTQLTRSSTGSDAELLADASHVSSTSMLYHTPLEQQGELPKPHGEPRALRPDITIASVGLNRFPTLPSVAPSTVHMETGALGDGLSLYNDEAGIEPIHEAATAAFLGSRNASRHEQDDSTTHSSLPRMDVKALEAASRLELGGLSVPAVVSHRHPSDAGTSLEQRALLAGGARGLVVGPGAAAAPLPVDPDVDLTRSSSDGASSSPDSLVGLVQRERAIMESAFERQRQELAAEQERQLQELTRTSLDGRSSRGSRGSRSSARRHAGRAAAQRGALPVAARTAPAVPVSVAVPPA